MKSQPKRMTSRARLSKAMTRLAADMIFRGKSVAYAQHRIDIIADTFGVSPIYLEGCLLGKVVGFAQLACGRR